MTDILDPYFYPWFAINFFLGLWAASQVVQFVLEHCVPCEMRELFRGLSPEKQRNTVTYVIEVVVTTFALVAQLYGGCDVLLKARDLTTLNRMNWMIISLQLVSVLYVWELIYRLRFGWPLLLHHLVTLLLIQVVTVSFFETQDILYIRFALLLGFNATTEQMNLWKCHLPRLFFVASAQALLCKSIATVGSVICFSLYCRDYDRVADGTWGAFGLFPLYRCS